MYTYFIGGGGGGGGGVKYVHPCKRLNLAKFKFILLIVWWSADQNKIWSQLGSNTIIFNMKWRRNNLVMNMETRELKMMSLNYRPSYAG